MADQVSIRLRLHYPGHKVGDVIKMDAAEADRLVNAKYATYEDAAPGEPVYVAPEPGAAPEGPVVELPADSALKSDWVAVAENLGLETEDKTKDEIVKAVKKAVGG
jgi:hypothetical protein